MISLTVAASPKITFTVNNTGDVSLSSSIGGSSVSITIGASSNNGGSGDVTGAANSLNNEIVVFSGTTGKVIKKGGKTIAEIESQIITDHNGLSNKGTNTHAQIDSHIASTSNPHGVTASQIGLGNVDNTSDANKPISTATQTALNLKESTSNKDTNNGYCGLDSGGKVPIANLPTTLLQYESVWNANTNTPTLTNPDLTKIGKVYTVTGGDATRFSISWKNGDWLIYNSSGIPEKSDNSDDVTSVNGQTGVVVLDADDIDDGSAVNKFVTQGDKDDFHTHGNKTILDNTTASFTEAQEDRLGFISVTQAVNLDTIETDSHTHSNKTILDNTTASFTTEDEIKLNSINGYILARSSGNIMY